MLDVRTRQRIDTARDILVGKVPDPTSQVEQITIALMFKFMDDMDAMSEGLGGKASFFAGDFKKYSWRRILSARVSTHETLYLYDEGIERMRENPDIPPLFRQIFRNASLPFRDPETLKAFLGVIDEFSYEDPEALGDAYEYLLSAMRAQGNAGQFRTPRHIIDFIVEVIDPKKNETILDPACGSAGFLVAAFNHIQKSNTDPDGTVRLTFDERSNLVKNISGYDIDPKWVRVALVNLYLHKFPAPKIFEYDTLTSDERWSEYVNVIMANPPFMTPTGGIKPHNRFSVKSKRSEVLFVDYIAEHLTAEGRAGVIVPEGIISRNQNAHKNLRKMLVEDYLVAVISLPQGVFKPYSGVKTSILMLDKALAGQSDTIGFFKVENDGFELGDQRRPIDQNDLPLVKRDVVEYIRRVREKDGVEACEFETGLVVDKKRIGADGEFNLSGERYRANGRANARYEWVALDSPGIFAVESGGTPKSDVPEYWDGDVPWITLVDLPAEDVVTEITSTKRSITEEGLRRSSAKLIPENSVVVSSRATIGRIGINRIPLATNQGFKNVVIEDEQRALPEYVARALTMLVPEMHANASGSTYKEITKTKFGKLHIPFAVGSSA